MPTPTPSTPPTIEDRTKMYLRLLESDLQGRLVIAANLARFKLIAFLGQPVSLLTPPSGAFTRIPGEHLARFLNGEKTFEGAETKVLKDYDGDWTRAKDLSRCTLVVNRAQDIRKAWSFVRNHFANNTRTGPTGRLVPAQVFDDPLGVNVVKNDFMFHSAKEINPENDSCGYSGYTVCVQSGGLIAEIQINSVTMMYAKSKNEFLAAFGKDRATALFSKYPTVPGFMGHDLYEVARKTGADPSYAAACKLYYDYFRSEPVNLQLGEKAAKALAGLDLGHKKPADKKDEPNKVRTPVGLMPSWMAASQGIWGRR